MSDNEINNEEVKVNQRSQMTTYITNSDKRKKLLKILLIIITVILINFFVISSIIICINRYNSNVYRNIYFLNNDMSNMDESKVIELVAAQVKNYNSEAQINFYQGDKNLYSTKSDDIKYELNAEENVKKIMKFGRTGNIIIDNYNIITALINPVHIDPVVNYNSEKLDETLKNIDLTIDNRYSDDTYSIDEKNNKLIIVNGKIGNTINYEEVKNNILNLLTKNTVSNYKLNIISKKPDRIDANKIYQNVKRDPIDAYIDKSITPYKYVSEVIGLDFSVEELNNVLNKSENLEEGKTLEFSLKVSQPKVKLSDITYTLYKDKLDGYTTYFDPNQSNRANNLNIALGYLNGVIVMPGEVFSYSKIIGDTTAAKGYLPASTFKGGTVVQEIGGGICQTVSTLYNVALKSNMQIIERHQHGLPVGYVKPSLDATVYGDILDFKFKNTRSYPVKIVTSFSTSGSLNVSLYGTKEDKEYEIELTSKYLYTIPYKTQYTYDNIMIAGQQVVVSKGVNGYASEAYITKKLDGKVISSTKLSSDVYGAQQQIVKVGTKEVINNVDNNKPVNIY